MRTLVHLRHGERERGGPHLTHRGVGRAASVGRRLAPFDRAVTSPKARAVETAEAMGYAVARQLPDLEGVPEAVERWLDRDSPTSFDQYVALVEEVREVRRYAQRLASVWREELEQLPEARRLLMVSHGEVIELGTVGALGDRVRQWGPALGLLEGVELRLEDGRWRRGSVVREPR